MKAITRASTTRQERRTTEILSSLDDHLLRDIGVVRTAIPHTARMATAGRAPSRHIAAWGVAAAIAMGATLTPEPAAATNSDVYCQGYAADAVRRHDDYRRKACGDRANLVWNPDYGVHHAYCKRVDLGTAEWVRSLRYSVILNDCATPKPAVAR
jgi:uncharacterized protein YjiS (DUF1127 family)